MANALYPFAKAQLQRKAIDMVNDTIKVSLIDTASYTYSSAHKYYTSLGGVTATATLGTKAVADSGTFSAANSTFTAATGAQSEALVIWRDSGVAGTSELIEYIDTGVTGLPVTPNGGDINITWNASGIFTL
jgi:hypothetical protein